MDSGINKVSGIRLQDDRNLKILSLTLTQQFEVYILTLKRNRAAMRKPSAMAPACMFANSDVKKT